MQVYNVKRGFKRKTITKAIHEKMEAWIKTLPKEMQQTVRSNYIVTGGAIASMLQGDLPKDYDVYFRNIETAILVTNHYIGKYRKENDENFLAKPIKAEAIGSNRVRIMIKSAGMVTDDLDGKDYRYFEQYGPAELSNYFDKHLTQGSDKKDKEFALAMLTDNAVSLHGQVQLIIRFIGPPEEIHKNYDFVHCTNWFTHEEGLHLNQDALESILSYELKYVGSLYPVCSLFRIKKFIQRGWTITAGEMLKIAWDINSLKLNDHYVLMEQLVGVDQAYFTQLLELLRDHKDIDRTYLFETINRVFDTEELEIMNQEETEE